MTRLIAIIALIMALAGMNYKTPAGGGDPSTTLRSAQDDRCGIGEAAYHEPVCGIGEAAYHEPD